MIQSIKIERLRGIREGELNDLTPLTILVGGNGSGKSTVLEALYIGANKSPAYAIGQSVLRRMDFPGNHRWLIWKEGREGNAVIDIKKPEGGDVICEVGTTDIFFRLLYSSTPQPQNDKIKFIQFDRNGFGQLQAQMIDARGGALATTDVVFNESPSVLLLEPQRTTSRELAITYDDVRKAGGHKELNALLSEVIPNLEVIEILLGGTEQAPVLHTTFSYKSVPVALAGEGILHLVHLALKMRIQPDGVVLIEEPEVHQHYRTMSLIAKVIWAAIRRDIQVILTTHSLEFIDAIIEEKPEDISEDKLSLVRTTLINGALIATSYTGEQVAFARSQFGEELR